MQLCKLIQLTRYISCPWDRIKSHIKKNPTVHHIRTHWLFISAAPHKPVPKYSNHPFHYKLTSLALQSGRHSLSQNKRIKATQRMFLLDQKSSPHTCWPAALESNLTAKITGRLVCFGIFWLRNKSYQVLQLIRKEGV